jgi:16S rRNA G966 N2-methylase RsmD
MIQFDYIKCPLHRYTFDVPQIKKWVESVSVGKTLNLFAGKTKLSINETRNDLDPEALSEYHYDALQFCKMWKGDRFHTIILDPPYAYRKSMEMYKGIVASPFKQLKDEILNIIAQNGRVVTFGYHSVSMGEKRGFKVYRVCLFSHGGAIHDTIATVEVLNG